MDGSPADQRAGQSEELYPAISKCVIELERGAEKESLSWSPGPNDNRRSDGIDRSSRPEGMDMCQSAMEYKFGQRERNLKTSSSSPSESDCFVENVRTCDLAFWKRSGGFSWVKSSMNLLVSGGRLSPVMTMWRKRYTSDLNII